MTVINTAERTAYMEGGAAQRADQITGNIDACALQGQQQNIVDFSVDFITQTQNTRCDDCRQLAFLRGQVQANLAIEFQCALQVPGLAVLRSGNNRSGGFRITGQGKHQPARMPCFAVHRGFPIWYNARGTKPLETFLCFQYRRDPVNRRV